MKLKTLIAAGAVAAIATTAFGATSLSSLQSQVAQLQAKVNAMGGSKAAAGGASLVRFDSNLANNLLVPQVGTQKEMSILQARQHGSVGNGLYVGGIVRATAAYSRLSKNATATAPVSIHTHVTNGKANAKTATQLNLPNVGLLAVAGINDWSTAILDLGADNVGRDGNAINLGVQEAYLLLGNMNKSAVYGFVGKKDVDFGNFSSVNFFAQPLNRLAFEVGAKDSVGVGFNTSGFNAVFSLFNGGANSTVPSTSVVQHNSATAYTQNKENINNFALNLDYGMNSNGVDWGVGGGYLNGSRYNYRRNATSTTALTAKGQRNGAWDLNGHFTVHGLKVIGEYDRTSGKASAYALGGKAQASNVQGYNLGAIYGFPLMGHKSAVNASFSRLKDDVNQASQFVLGWNNELFSNVWLGLEWDYNKGLINGSTIGSSSFDAPSNSMGIPTADGSKDNTLLLNLTATF